MSGNRVGRRSVGSGQRGWVTAEMAFAGLGAGLALVFCAGVFSIALGQIRCSDAAAEIARQAAREDVAMVNQIESGLPESSSVQVNRDGDFVVVSVSMDFSPWGSWLPAYQVHASASVAYEGESR